MKWGFKRSKEKEEQTPEAVTEEVTEEAESIEEEAKESSEAEPMEDTSEESSETEPTEDTSEQNSVTESSENESEENSETEKKQGFFSRLVAGLTKTRDSFVSGIDSIFSGFSSIDDDFYEEIEEILIMGDIGVRATQEILDNLQQKVKENHIKQPQECKELLIQSIKEQMEVGETAYRFEHEKSVVLVVGVNGVGKTTSVGKLAGKLKAQGRKVVLAAADTFRAAAGAQLEEWAHRAGVDMIGGQEGADPAAVVYDAVAAAKARKADVLLCDTAGRLHNKKNLMEELKKINRIIDKEYPDAFRETLVVLDGTTGQNALAQAKQFMEVADITGIILTKMDGTAKGGIAVAIQSELGIPVKYIGVGETIDDLQKFDSEQFVDALFSTREE
ncbi:MAG TPA: signal recognition particle-docking protein FtsY [Lachnospiraceae bacterium]|nr:signal recognition particle-docking protein FtsY [Lachnospiraceae bacterium]